MFIYSVTMEDMTIEMYNDTLVLKHGHGPNAKWENDYLEVF